MRQIRLSNSLHVYARDLNYLEAAVNADPDTRDLAPSVASQRATWLPIFEKESEAERAVVQFDALVTVRDAQVDALTTKVGGLALLEANQDRKSAFFRRICPMPPSQLVALGLRRQCQHTIDSMIPELRKLPDSSPLKAMAEPLAQACTSAIESLEGRGKAMGARGVVANEVEEWKEGTNRFRSAIYAELLKRAAEKGYPKSWADRFFRPAPGIREAVDEDVSEPAGADLDPSEQA